MKKMMFLVLSFTIFASASFAYATSKSLKLTGQLPNGYSQAAFYSKKGYYTSGTVSGKKFSITVKRSELKGGSIILNKVDRSFGGAVVLAQKGAKSFLQFAESKTAASIAVGTVVVSANGYLKLKKSASTSTYDSKSFATTSQLGSPLGLNVASSSAVHTKSISTRANVGDTDRDGVPDGMDVDSDGDGSVDALTGGATATAESPGLIIREGMGFTINETATGIPSLSVIDSILTSNSSSEFVMGFGFRVQSDLASISGAHVVCDDNDTLCGRNAGLATVNGVSQTLWKDYHPDGSTYPGLDVSSGGGDEEFYSTAIKPHVGPSVLPPGTTYRVEFTGAGGSVIRSKLAIITPYLVTVPAIGSYTANAASHTVDYSNISTEPGASMGLPIILGSDGVLSITFWRPQRQGLGGADGTGYIDVGNLRYGVVFSGQVGGGGGGNGEQPCAGYYSSLSSSLTDNSTTPPTNDFWSLKDSASDSTPSTSNTLSFSVDLKSCAARAGFGVGDYIFSLQGAGDSDNRSGQDFTVRIQ